MPGLLYPLLWSQCDGRTLIDGGPKGVFGQISLSRSSSASSLRDYELLLCTPRHSGGRVHPAYALQSTNSSLKDLVACWFSQLRRACRVACTQKPGKAHVHWVMVLSSTPANVTNKSTGSKHELLGGFHPTTISLISAIVAPGIRNRIRSSPVAALALSSWLASAPGSWACCRLDAGFGCRPEPVRRSGRSAAFILASAHGCIRSCIRGININPGTAGCRWFVDHNNSDMQSSERRSNRQRTPRVSPRKAQHS